MKSAFKAFFCKIEPHTLASRKLFFKDPTYQHLFFCHAWSILFCYASRAVPEFDPWIALTTEQNLIICNALSSLCRMDPHAILL